MMAPMSAAPRPGGDAGIEPAERLARGSQAALPLRRIENRRATE